MWDIVVSGVKPDDEDDDDGGCWEVLESLYGTKDNDGGRRRTKISQPRGAQWHTSAGGESTIHHKNDKSLGRCCDSDGKCCHRLGPQGWASDYSPDYRIHRCRPRRWINRSCVDVQVTELTVEETTSPPWPSTGSSSIAVGNGVGVAAGSWYAACQSAAMGGAALIGAPTVLTVAAVPAVGYVGYRLYMRMS